MQEVTVKKDELLAKLKVNRENHRKIFLEAQEGYRRKVIDTLDSMLRDAREGKRIRVSFCLPEPQDQTHDYDRAIAMLEMSTESEVTISESDFACYVLDQWAWRDRFLTSNSNYSVTAARLSNA